MYIFFWFWFTIIFSIYLHDERNFICVVAVCRIASIFKTQRLSIICLVSVLSQIRYSSYTSPIWSTITHASLRKLNVIIDLAINAVPCHFISSESNDVYHPRKQFLPIQYTFVINFCKCFYSYLFLFNINNGNKIANILLILKEKRVRFYRLRFCSDCRSRITIDY